MGISHARAYTKLEGFEICGVVTRSLGSSQDMVDELGPIPQYVDFNQALGETKPDAVSISSYTETHFPYTISALDFGCHVFVEKPLAINQKELDLIFDFYQKKSVEKILHVGYNRRFSPHAIKVKNLLGDASDMNIVATMNAGYIPPDVWVHDMKVGGGRIIGEACHFIDLMIFITGSLVEDHTVVNSIMILVLE